jgi:hypothetical protein
MRFLSIWRHPVYVVRPAAKTVIAPGQVNVDRGLRAEFREGGWPEGGNFDTEAEQRRLNWTDEDREAVERHLLNHSDFGVGIFLEEQVGAEPDTVPDAVGCAFATITDDGAERCGKRRAKGSQYCKKHEELVNPKVPQEA